jgi:hypothetical protein
MDSLIIIISLWLFGIETRNHEVMMKGGPHNLPQVFWGLKGNKRLLFLIIVSQVLAIGILIWVLVKFGIIAAIVIAILALAFAPIVAKIITPSFIIETAIAPYFCTIGFAILNIISWVYLR